MNTKPMTRDHRREQIRTKLSAAGVCIEDLPSGAVRITSHHGENLFLSDLHNLSDSELRYLLKEAGL